VVLAASDLNRDVLVGYVMQYEPLTPLVEQVRHFVKPANPVLPTFNGSADTHLDAHPKVRRFGDGANGFVRYGISPRLERDHPRLITPQLILTSKFMALARTSGSS